MRILSLSLLLTSTAFAAPDPDCLKPTITNLREPTIWTVVDVVALQAATDTCLTYGQCLEQFTITKEGHYAGKCVIPKKN